MNILIALLLKKRVEIKKVLLCRKNRSVRYNSAKDSEGSVSIQRDSEPMLFFPHSFPCTQPSATSRSSAVYPVDVLR